MRYELLLQSGDPAVPYEPSGVEAQLAQRKLVQRPDGVRLWQLKSGDVEVGSVMEGGRQVATEIRIPLRESLDLVHEALVESAELAVAAQVRLFDPQLMKLVTALDQGVVGEQYFRTARYAGEMMGVSEALGASIPPVDDRLLQPGTRVALGIFGGMIAMFWLMSRC